MVDTSGSIKGAVAIVVITVVLLAMTPTVVDQVQNLNTTGWTFTGYEGAKALIGLIPFLWVAGILAGAAVGMFTLFKTRKE
jgi:hypothetical protein